MRCRLMRMARRTRGGAILHVPAAARPGGPAPQVRSYNTLLGNIKTTSYNTHRMRDGRCGDNATCTMSMAHAPWETSKATCAYSSPQAQRAQPQSAQTLARNSLLGHPSPLRHMYRTEQTHFYRYRSRARPLFDAPDPTLVPNERSH